MVQYTESMVQYTESMVQYTESMVDRMCVVMCLQTNSLTVCLCVCVFSCRSVFGGAVPSVWSKQ